MKNPREPSTQKSPDGPHQNTKPLSREEAYDKARTEFYNFRLQEDVERRVGREEAEMTGAYFGMTNLEIGMQLEDEQYEKWRADAFKVMEAQRLRSGALAGDSPAPAVLDEEAFEQIPEQLPVDDKVAEAAQVDDDDD